MNVFVITEYPIFTGYSITIALTTKFTPVPAHA